MPELIDRALHRVDRCARQRFGHVADATSNQTLGRFRIFFGELADAPRDLWKKITRLKLEIVFV